MLREYLRLARPFLVLLALFAVGRWAVGVGGLDYTKGHHIFSLVTLTVLGCIFYAAFARRWLGYPIMMNTYFNHPTALNAEGPVAFGPAMGGRVGGLVANTLFAGIAAALGWVFGGALPDSPAPRRETVA